MSNLIHLNSRQCTAILSFFNPFLRKYIPTIGIDRVEISSLDSGNYEAMKKTLIIMVANTKGGFRCKVLINDWLWLNSNQLSINLQADINQMQIKYQANIKQIQKVGWGATFWSMTGCGEILICSNWQHTKKASSAEDGNHFCFDNDQFLILEYVPGYWKVILAAPFVKLLTSFGMLSKPK